MYKQLIIIAVVSSFYALKPSAAAKSPPTVKRPKIEKCPRGVPIATCACAKEPCECLGEICQEVPDATCLIDGCNGCNVVFFDGLKRLTEEDCKGCQSGGFVENCDPCAEAKCPDFPNSRCEARRCKQCKAVFYKKNREEIETCCKNDICPDGNPRFHCKSNPCDGAKCPNHPNAECVPNFCGGCKAEFYLSRRKLEDVNCVIYERCPPCDSCPPKECTNPCSKALCPAYPGARCVSQECGDCKAVFYDENREVVNCGIPIGVCEDGVIQYKCPFNPCEMHSCPAVENAECVPNYCGGCKANFYYPDGRRIFDLYCSKTIREKCYHPIPLCGRGGCQDTCRMVPDAECFVDACNGCREIFYKGQKRLTEEDCNDCPVDAPRLDCGDICANALCPLYPNARCEPRVCGECRAVFYGLDRMEIKDCCGTPEEECPPESPKVECVIDPCETSTCPAKPSAKCRINFCGRCKAEFYLGSRKLTDMQCVKYADRCSAFTKCAPVRKCSCPTFPDAQCIQQYCPPNACSYLYFDKDGNSLTYEQCGLCENGEVPINCGVVPQCSREKCAAFPDAICKSSNCGECVTWFENKDGKQVNCVVKKECRNAPPRIANGFVILPKGSKIFEGDSVTYTCKAGMTTRGRSTRRCVLKSGRPRLTGSAPRCVELNECASKPCHKLATCTNTQGSFYCTCNFGYLGDGINQCSMGDYRCPKPTGFGICIDNCESTKDCARGKICCSVGCAKRCQPIPANLCPDGSLPRKCFVNPCLKKTCRRHPRALCIPNYCKGCVAEFYDGIERIEDC